MKLKNKKTGEIRYLKVIYDDLEPQEGEWTATSLAELNEEWEDVPEEQKEYWAINEFGTLVQVTHSRENIYDISRKNFGNYFETKEEAEKAVEKFKAVKRLKDYNVKFNLDFVHNKIDFTYSVNNPLLSVLDGEEQIFNNMKIIFGGEE